jgi:sugar/nucleoside kinase (ribokinase family)
MSNTSLIAPCRSTVGAGDTFIAGIIFAYASLRWSSLHKVSLNQALDFALELAGRKVLGEGFQGLGDAMNSQIAELYACTSRHVTGS